MKKIFTLSLVSLFLLTGCNFEKIECTDEKENNEVVHDCVCNCIDISQINDEELVGKTFTKTYKIYNIAPSNDFDYVYITIRGFQEEEIDTVKVKRELFETLEEENYEFTFKITDGRIKENIEDIFNYSELVSVIKTDKTGLEQVNEYLVDLK